MVQRGDRNWGRHADERGGGGGGGGGSRDNSSLGSQERVDINCGCRAAAGTDLHPG